MSDRLNEYGSVEFTIAASDKLAIFSRDRVKVYYAAVPVTSKNPAWALLVDNPPETEYTSSAFSAANLIRIETEGSPAYYAAGTAPVISERRGLRGQGAPGVLDATGTLTAAMIASGIVTSAAAAVTATLDTGAIMDAALQMEIGESIDWSVIKVGANAFTVTASTGHTIVGVAAVAATSSGLFRTRKTAASTFVTYRIG